MVSEEQPMGSGPCPLSPAPSMSRPPQVVKECRLPSLPRPLTPSWATPRQHHNSGTSPHPQSFWNASLGTPAPTGCWDGTGNHRAGRMQQRKACSPARPSGGPRPLPSRSRDRAGSHRHPKYKRTCEKKQTETDESHPGWRRRAGAPPKGTCGAHLMNASGLGYGFCVKALKNKVILVRIYRNISVYQCRY